MNLAKTLIVLALGLSASGVSAATVSVSLASQANGLSTTTGVGVDGSFQFRVGVFDAAFDFAANEFDQAALEAGFTEVASVTGVPFSGFDGYWGPSDPTSFINGIDDQGTYEGVGFQSDIKGKPIFLWVQDAGWTQQGIFSTGSEIWQDATGSQMSHTLQSNIAGGVNVHIGGDLTGPELFSGLGPSYQLSTTVIPEPSRAVLGLLGLGAVFLRRRR